jgi:hypothetical protein
VAHETDFLDLYRRLGLNPGCDLAELKQAYRRHVAALHPDRQQGRSLEARTAARLQRLTAQYGAAMDFHRRYGRLPGAPQTGPVPTSSGMQGLSSVVSDAHDPFVARRASSDSPFTDEASRSGRRSHGRLAAVMVIAALGVLGWALLSTSFAPTDSGDEEVAGQAGAGSVSHENTAPDVMLHEGMSPDEVRAVEGEPLAMHGELWEYGPSWIRFDHDEVVEWHSSPLRPLHTEAHATSVGR